MEYGLCKKLVFLLYEYYYSKDNVQFEEDLCGVINQLEKRNWSDLGLIMKNVLLHYKTFLQGMILKNPTVGLRIVTI